MLGEHRGAADMIAPPDWVQLPKLQQLAGSSMIVCMLAGWLAVYPLHFISHILLT